MKISFRVLRQCYLPLGKLNYERISQRSRHLLPIKASPIKADEMAVSFHVQKLSFELESRGEPFMSSCSVLDAMYLSRL